MIFKGSKSRLGIIHRRWDYMIHFHSLLASVNSGSKYISVTLTAGAPEEEHILQWLILGRSEASVLSTGVTPSRSEGDATITLIHRGQFKKIECVLLKTNGSNVREQRVWSFSSGRGSHWWCRGTHTQCLDKEVIDGVEGHIPSALITLSNGLQIFRRHPT